MHCYQTIRQIAKKLFLKGGKFVLGWLVGVYTLHTHAQSPNVTMKTLILSVTHMIWCGCIKALVVRCWYRLINTYINTLEYTELLNRLILIRYMEVRNSLLYYLLLIIVREFYMYQLPITCSFTCVASVSLTWLPYLLSGWLNSLINICD